MDEARDQGPRSLARAVLRALSLTEMPLPEERLLCFFFDVLHEASFRGEQGRQAQGRVLWIGVGAAPDTAPAGRLSLTSPAAFNAGALVSLLPAVQGREAALIVSASADPGPADHGLVICGIAPGCALPHPPGGFCVEIVGPAHLRVDAGLDAPLELRRNQLHTSAFDVLQRGPVRARLSASLAGLLPAIEPQLPPDVAASPLLRAGSLPLPGGGVLISENDWPELLEQFWVDALSRLLSEIWQARRACLVLITGGQALPEEGWATPPHGAGFSELGRLLEQRAVQAVTEQVRAAEALGQAGPLGGMPPGVLTRREPGLRVDAGGAPAIARAIGFLAGLARVDGLLVLDARLGLRCFGGQFGPGPLPEVVYLAGDEAATEEGLSPIDVRSFGPRNQSLLAQCRQNPAAAGFALTQDGDVRAMLWHGDRLVVWNRVRLSLEGG